MTAEEADALQSILLLLICCGAIVAFIFAAYCSAESFVSKLIRSFEKKAHKKEDHEPK